MTKYTIFGRCYGLVSMTIDSLYNTYGNDVDIDIVSNIPPDTTEPFAIVGMNPINEYMHNDYTYDALTNNVIMGVASPNAKRQIFTFFKEMYNIDIHAYCNIIPTTNTHISKTVSIQNGCHIEYGTTIAPYASLGNFITINRNCSIGHHTRIGNYVTLSPAVNIAGNCIIGDSTTIGIGANVINNITIGENCIIGAGSLVTKDIPPNTVWYGVPARYIRDNIPM